MISILSESIIASQNILGGNNQNGDIVIQRNSLSITFEKPFISASIISAIAHIATFTNFGSTPIGYLTTESVVISTKTQVSKNSYPDSIQITPNKTLQAWATNSISYSTNNSGPAYTPWCTVTSTDTSITFNATSGEYIAQIVYLVVWA